MIKKVKLISAALIAVIFVSCDFSQLFYFEEEILTGFISGSIEDNWGQPMSGVEVNVAGNYDYRTTTDSMGYYYLEAPEGYQWLDFYKDGYSFNSIDLYVYEGFTEYVDTVIPWSEPETTGKITGKIIDATTGNGLDSVSVSLSGDSFYQAFSDGAGNFSILIPEGHNVLSFSKSNYYIEDVEVNATAWQETVLDRSSVIGSPSLAYGEVRFILTWGEQPSDLDVYMLTPDGSRVYRSNNYGDGAEFHDDATSGYGPEAITITSPSVGNYRFYVYNFSNTTYFYNSGAKVKVYDYSGLIHTFETPGSGFGRYWDVATFNNGYLTPHDTVIDSEPVNIQ